MESPRDRRQPWGGPATTPLAGLSMEVSPPRPCWGSSPEGCSQMQPPWNGETSGQQRRPAGGGLQGKWERTGDSLEPPRHTILHTADPPIHHLSTSCSLWGEPRGTTQPHLFPTLPCTGTAPHLHKGGQSLPLQLWRECAGEPRPSLPSSSWAGGGAGQAGCSVSRKGCRRKMFREQSPALRMWW